MKANMQKEVAAGSERRKCPHCGREVSVDSSKCPSCHFFLNWADILPNRWCFGVQVPFSGSKLGLLLWLAIAGKLLLLLDTPSVDEVLQLGSAWASVLGHLFRTVGECGLLYGLSYGLRFERRQMPLHILLLILALAALGCFSILWTFRGVLPMPGLQSHSMFLFGMVLLVTMQSLYLLLGVRLCYCYHGNLSLLGSAMIVVVMAQAVLNFGFRLLGANAYWDIMMFGAYAFYLYMLYGCLFDRGSYQEKKREMMI